jgi:carbon monoxide dehydrogenase subunit G
MFTMSAKMSYYIDAPVEAVFDFLKDPTNQVDYQPFGDLSVGDVTMTEDGVGSFYSWKVKMAGFPISGFDVYTEVEPNKHLREMSSNAMVGTWDYRVEPEGKGTRLTMEHHQRSLWALPPLRNLTDYTTRRLTRAFVDSVTKQLAAGATVPSQRKPSAAKPRKTAASH